MKTLRIFLFMIPLLMLLGCKNQQERDSGRKRFINENAKTDRDNRQAEKPDTSDYQQHRKLQADNKGIGPIDSLELGNQIDQEMADKGKKIFENVCSRCHRLHDSSVGPALAGVLQERSPAWVMNMILNTQEMLEKDPEAMSMKAEYKTPMIQTDLSKEEARQVVEYLRKL